jgi:hypothetical protein
VWSARKSCSNWSSLLHKLKAKARDRIYGPWLF